MVSPYQRYITSCRGLARSKTNESDASIRTKDADFGRYWNFKRLAFHHITLAPGARTSLPHAESHEEEFVFVISGHPHAWIDGYVYELRPNCAAGFPAGTGIAHCFINNSASDVELLVLGERTKKENRCFFPVNPEQKVHLDLWWADAPQRPLGPHNGRPGQVLPQEISAQWPSCLVDCAQLERNNGWHYGGDSETFSHFARVTDSLGLKILGIGFETLQPGHRSAFPHAHKYEEEFVFILKNTATIWMNGYASTAQPGDGVGFPSATGIAHSVLNDTDQPLHYIVVGEASDPNNEDCIFYPMHPFRNEQCRRGKFLWEDQPRGLPFGPHDGRAKQSPPDHLAFRFTKPEEAELVLELFQKSPDYFRRVDGCLPSIATAKESINGGPKNPISAYYKEFLIIEHDDQPIGVIDLHLHHPFDGSAYIGLLLISDEYKARSLGRRSYHLAEHYLQKVHGAKRIRLGVSDDHDVSEFWRRMGFQTNGRTYEWKGEQKSTRAQEYEKAL